MNKIWTLNYLLFLFYFKKTCLFVYTANIVHISFVHRLFTSFLPVLFTQSIERQGKLNKYN